MQRLIDRNIETFVTENLKVFPAVAILGPRQCGKSTLGCNFCMRVSFIKKRFEKGGISATARKLSVIIWNMIVKNQPYRNDYGYEFLDQKRKRKVIEAKKLIQKFSINLEELTLSIKTI